MTQGIYHEWIPVSDKLPEKKGRYLIVVHAYGPKEDTKFIFEDWYTPGEPNWSSFTNSLGVTFVTTHWMPIPELP